MAEVLITLGIIGVVAAMTLPSLITKHQDKSLAVSMRKLYSDVNNALRLSQTENDGQIDYSTVFNPENTSYETALALSKYFNGAKVCENNSANGCSKYYYNIKYSTAYYAESSGKVNFDNHKYKPAIILNNGGILYISQWNSPDCHNYDPNAPLFNKGEPVLDENGNQMTYVYEDHVCGLIYFDTNGIKGPNQYGRDASRFSIEKNKIKTNAQPFEGRETLINILQGKDELIYNKF